MRFNYEFADSLSFTQDRNESVKETSTLHFSQILGVPQSTIHFLKHVSIIFGLL